MPNLFQNATHGTVYAFRILFQVGIVRRFQRIQKKRKKNLTIFFIATEKQVKTFESWSCIEVGTFSYEHLLH